MKAKERSRIMKAGSLPAVAAIRFGIVALLLSVGAANVGFAEESDATITEATKPEYVRPIPPKMVEGYFENDRKNDYNIIYRLEFNANLPEEVVDFLMAAAREPELGYSIYHRMACILVFQETRPKEMYDLFLELDDSIMLSELVGDNEYSYLAENRLRESAFDDKDTYRSMRALVQLANLENQKKVTLGPEYDARLIQKLTDPKSDEYTMVGALGVVCTREMKSALDLMRSFVDNPHPDYLRFALAALGKIGDATDLPRIEPHLTNEDDRISMAAQAAFDRIKKRLAPPEKGN